MKLFGLSLFFITSVIQANECTMELYSKIYRLEQNQSLQVNEIIHRSDCATEINGKLSSLVSNSQGTVGADFLKTELQKDFPETTVNFVNRKLSLLNLNSTVRTQLTPETNLYFTQTRSLNGLGSVGLVEGETLHAVCDACQTYGEKNIKLNIINVALNSTRTVWFNSKIMARIKEVKAKKSISFQQKALNADDFYYDEILTLSPDKLLTSLENIQYFKTNRTLLQGATVSSLDLQPVNLVSFGTPVNVLLKSNNISLQRTAMPVRSAKFGDTVEMKGPNNKLIAGKVIDYNKVVIEL